MTPDFDRGVKWNIGRISSALENYDFNGDGVIDVCFYQGTKTAGITATSFIDVTTSTDVGKRQLSNGTLGEVLWNPGVREWLDKKYLSPIPETDRIKNTALGQNPGW